MAGCPIPVAAMHQHLARFELVCFSLPSGTQNKVRRQRDARIALAAQKSKEALVCTSNFRILGELGLCLGLCTRPISAHFARPATEAPLLSVVCRSMAAGLTSPTTLAALLVRTLARAAPPPPPPPGHPRQPFPFKQNSHVCNPGFSANFQPFGIPTFSSHYAHLHSLYPWPHFFEPLNHRRRALLPLLILVDPSPFASLNRRPHFVFDDLLMHQ